MNKKILIGSIIAVAILVLVSFTGVVGYQTTKSSTIAKASPLFAVRSSRAIDEESKDIRAYIEMKSDEDCDCISESDSNVELQDKYPVICSLLALLYLSLLLFYSMLPFDLVLFIFLPIWLLGMALDCFWTHTPEPKIQGMINSNYTNEIYKTLLESK